VSGGLEVQANALPGVGTGTCHPSILLVPLFLHMSWSLSSGNLKRLQVLCHDIAALGGVPVAVSVAGAAGFEPATLGLEIRSSVH
jgi:hypothetical protein